MQEDKKQSKRKKVPSLKLIKLEELDKKNGTWYYEIEYKKRIYKDRFYAPGLKKSLTRVDKNSLIYKIWSLILIKLEGDKNVHKANK